MIADELRWAFEKLAADNRLAQSYMFFDLRHSGAGESDDDKLIFVQNLAGYLENREWQLSPNLLDASMIDGGGIDEVRVAKNFLWQKPLKSSRKTLIIRNADNLTIEAQNAILKISEEAPPSALIILLLSNPESLLATLQSRFQKIFIHNATYANDTSKIAKEFLKAVIAQRKAIIKNLIDDEKELSRFVAGLIAELRKDRIKNWPAIKNLLHRWTLINQFNTNKLLQLEAVLLNI